MAKIKLELTQKQAERLGIVFCTCGHPPNNHFMDQKGKICAHCLPGKCNGYHQVIHLP